MSIRDNPVTMTTDVEVQHVVEYVNESVLGETLWTATLVNGIELKEGWQFRASDYDTFTGATRSANPLVVIPEGDTPANAYEIVAGRHQLTYILGRINNWLDQALTDTDLLTTQKLAYTVQNEQTHGKWRIVTPAISAGHTWRMKLSMPHTILLALGGFDGAEPDDFYNWIFERTQPEDSTAAYTSTGPTLQFSGLTADVINEFGDFFDQTDSLPSGMFVTPNFQALGQIGFCLIDGLPEHQLAVVAKDGSKLHMMLINVTGGLAIPQQLQIASGHVGEVKIRQAIIMRDTFANVMKSIFYSTGTAGFNHATWDRYPQALGLAIPAELLGEKFETSIDLLSGADSEITVIHGKPQKLENIFHGALILRSAFLRWHEGASAESPAAWNDPRSTEQQRGIAREARDCWIANPRPFTLGYMQTDAGRAAAGFEPWEDCTIRAVATGLDITYQRAAELLVDELKGDNTPGFTNEMVGRILTSRGWRFTWAWTPAGHLHLESLPKKGRVVVSSVGHTFAVIDGIIHDEAPPPPADAKPLACVLGWWRKPYEDAEAELAEQRREIFALLAERNRK